jgi:hypothetical protein
MVSEDINATMNYSVMSTRSVITHTHTYVRGFTSARCSRQAKAGGVGAGCQRGAGAKRDKSADLALN